MDTFRENETTRLHSAHEVLGTCELHFAPECYPAEYRIKQSLGIEVKKKRLLPDAVPTIHFNCTQAEYIYKYQYPPFTKQVPVQMLHTFPKQANLKRHQHH